MPSLDELRHLMGAVFDAISSEDEKQASRREEFIFHMLDWIDDAKELVSLCDDPRRWDPKEAARIVYGFLAHAVPHLRRAIEIADGDGVSDSGSSFPSPEWPKWPDSAGRK